MLTGDNQATAKAIAREVGIDEGHAELLPEDEVNQVRDLVRALWRGRDGHPKKLNRLSVAVQLKETAYCDPSTVRASSHFLFLRRLRKEEAICRRSFRSDDPRSSDRA